MGINKVAKVGKGSKNPLPIKEKEIEDYRTPRPTTQQKSTLGKEHEEAEEIVREVADKVHNEMESRADKAEEKAIKANKLWEQVLQVHRVELYEVDGKNKERYIPQGKLQFTTDDKYNKWVLDGGMDRDLKVEFDYIVLRRLIAKEV